jgi:DNA-directed RNA polymerase specialized sigma24 family protein
MENHYQYAGVETDFTKQVVDETLMEKFLVNGSATQHVAQRGFAPAERREAGLPAANLETFISGPMRNAIIDYLWKIEGQKADELLAPGNHKNVQSYDDDGELPAAEVEDDDDHVLFADFDLPKITEEFESCLPDEAHRAVFRTYVANGNGLEATARLLGIGVKTCQKYLDTKNLSIWILTVSPCMPILKQP